jgi:hypothetical protein
MIFTRTASQSGRESLRNGLLRIESPRVCRRPIALRANKSETFDCLKFTLEGEGDRTHGNAFTDAAFTGCRI